MRSNTVLPHSRRKKRGWALAVVLFIALLLASSYLFLNNTQRRLTEAEDLVNAWDLVAAEKLLSELLANNPETPEVRRLHAEVALKRGNLATARNALGALAVEDSAFRTKHLLSLAQAHFYFGNLDSSAEIVHRLMAGKGRQEPPDTLTLAQCYHVLGRIAFNRGAYDSARTFQTQSLLLARRKMDPRTEADALRQLGVLLWYGGKADSARRFFYEPALALYRAIRDCSGEATTLSNLGHLDNGIALQLRSFVIRNRIGDQIGLADSYYFLSPFTGDERLNDLAYTYRRKSFDLSARIGYAWGREVAARSLTEMLFHAFDERTAGTPLHDSSFVTSSEGRIHELLWQGTALARNGDWRGAAALQERAIHVCDSLGYASGLSVAFGNYAISLMELGDLEGAERAAARSYASFDDEMSVGNLLLAQVLLKKKQYRDAYRLLSNAARKFDAQYAARIANPEFSFLVGWLTKKRFELYSKLISSAAHVGNTDTVLHTMEQYRSLLYNVGDPSAGLRHGEHGGLWSKYRTLLRQMDNLHPDESHTKAEEFIAEFAAASARQARYAGIVHNLRSRHIPPLDEIQRSMDGRSILLQFFVGEHDVCVLTIQQSDCRLFRLGVSPGQVTDASRTLQETIVRGASMPTDTLWTTSAAFLYEQLIAPLEREGVLERRTHLIISPSGVLHTVPFAALLEPAKRERARRRFLVEKFEIGYIPSAAGLVRHRAITVGPGRSLAVAPDQSTLPFSEQEVLNIPAQLSAQRTLLVNSEATADRVLNEIPHHDIVHIAAHGKLVPHSPLHSYLQLADRKLELAEILTLQLPPATIILSACETGAGAGMTGDLSKGHIVVSFPIAFLLAGADAVISPMWRVHDEAAFHLMSGFYRHLLKDNHRSSALASAQRDFLGSSGPSGKFSTHPFFWAGFYVVGNDVPFPASPR